MMMCTSSSSTSDEYLLTHHDSIEPVFLVILTHEAEDIIADGRQEERVIINPPMPFKIFEEVLDLHG